MRARALWHVVLMFIKTVIKSKFIYHSLKVLLIVIFIIALNSETTGVNADTKFLFVDVHEAIKLGWTRMGSSPYLNNNSENYIYTKLNNRIEGIFDYDNATFNSGIINNVIIYFECYASNIPTDDGFDIFIFNGTAWFNIGTIFPSYSDWGHLENLDASSILDTWEKINQTKLSVSYFKLKKADAIFIRRSYLSVDYTAPEQPSPGNLVIYRDIDNLVLKIELLDYRPNTIEFILNKFNPKLQVNLKLDQVGPEYLKIIIVTKDAKGVTDRQEDFIILDVGEEFNGLYVLPLKLSRGLLEKKPLEYDVDVMIFRLHDEPLKVVLTPVTPPARYSILRTILLLYIFLLIFYEIFRLIFSD